MIVKGETGQLIAKGVEYRDATGEIHSVHAEKEVILSAGAIGSPHLLMLSGIGPRGELEAAGLNCLLDQPHVGKHLKDHLFLPMYLSGARLGPDDERARTLARSRRVTNTRGTTAR